MTEQSNSPADPGATANDTAARSIRAHLRTAGDGLPDPLRSGLIASPSQGPSKIIESAEGVTTFGGFTDSAASDRLMKRVEKLAAEYPLPGAPMTDAPEPPSGSDEGD